MVFADAIAPRKVDIFALRAYQFLLIVCGSALIALSAQISINLPFSPVPITGQTFGVLLVAALLGRVRGTLAVISYLIEGMSGLPVFAGGVGGFWYAFGPTGGYLLGFIPAAFVVGYLAEKGFDRNVVRTALAMAIGSVIVMGFGALRLGAFVGYSHAMVLGFYPFLIGDLIKIGAAAVVLPSLRRFV
jgi:biotin transport system substrate-specific component